MSTMPPPPSSISLTGTATNTANPAVTPSSGPNSHPYHHHHRLSLSPLRGSTTPPPVMRTPLLSPTALYHDPTQDPLLAASSSATATSNTALTTSPFCPSSPYRKSQQSAIDAALAAEKQRIHNLELQEDKYTTLDEFRSALKRERQHSKHLAMELASLKSVAVTSTLEAEMHEEGRINCLMRRLDGLQKEKGRIIVELEREEEMLTNTLQKKLNEVRREKAELEKQIEREHRMKEKLESYIGANHHHILDEGNDVLEEEEEEVDDDDDDDDDDNHDDDES